MGLFDAIKAQVGFVKGVAEGVKEAKKEGRTGKDAVGGVLYHGLAKMGKALGFDSPDYETAKKLAEERKKTEK